MRIREIKLNTKVKVVREVKYDSCPMDNEYMGQVGTITRVGNGKNVEEMIQVTFADGSADAFWPEELKVVKE